MYGLHFCYEGVYLLPAEAVYYVIVDHADGLHKGVADGRADEGEAKFL